MGGMFLSAFDGEGTMCLGAATTNAAVRGPEILLE